MAKRPGDVRGTAGLGSRSFASEAQLVRSARRLVRAALSTVEAQVRLRYEVSAPGGVPDLVLYSHDGDELRYVVTMEFKLKNWRRALRQAFRHRNYVNEAYVVLDEARASAAIENIEEFEKANVGLATASRDGSVTVWHFPKPELPFSRRFSRALARQLLSGKKTLPRDLPFTRTVRGGIPIATLRAALVGR